MKEQLYTIPVNDIFDQPCECPICSMRNRLDEESVAFSMGASYMEDDIRMETDKVGFCPEHMQMLYDYENRLGLALVMNTHMKYLAKNIEALQKKGRNSVGGLFSKKATSPLLDYLKKSRESCYICQRNKKTFERYIATTFYLFERDENFRTKFKSSLGFCLEHYELLYKEAPQYLTGDTLADFTKVLDKTFLSNFNRVQEDVSWFIDKFDYKNADEPWKTSKDSIPRAITKVSGIL